MIYLFFWIEAMLLLGLTCFGLHRLWLLVLFLKHRRNLPLPNRYWKDFPAVTIQLPIYNEPFVVERLLESVAKIDYPRDRLEIQILDDSTDDTLAILESKVKKLKNSGLDISLIHRNHRREYKAGALAEGLCRAKGEFLSIFDADFVPAPDFLKKTIPYFTDPQIGMIQTRWGHLNRNFSQLTRIQALWLDAHFRVEQLVRSRGGYCFNFNGSAGVWRREAILSAGGWRGDTLTEDLDLSYRAQLAGWKGIYLDDVVVPGELPIDMNGLKSQQHRWTKGSIETALKLLPKILRSHALTRPQKLEACFHLGNWLHFVLAVFLVLLAFPSLVIHQRLVLENQWALLRPLLAFESFLGTFLILSTVLFYALSQRNQMRWWQVVLDIPWLMAISVGLSLNNSRAIFEALLGHRTGFHRTPKLAIASSKKFRLQPSYLLPRQGLWGIELLIGFYIIGVILYACAHQFYGIIPFLIPIGFGFLYAGFGSVIPLAEGN